MIWKVPKMWEGQTVFILGGGPSLLKVDLSLVHKRRCIGVNNSYLLGEWIDILWFGDSRWLEWHSTLRQFSEGWRAFKGIRCSCISRVKDNESIKYVELSSKQFGIETNPLKICWNKTSGTSAINLAYHLGARKIVLIGFDMQITNKQENWHNDHVIHGKSANPYPRFLKPIKDISKDLKELNVEIVNTCMDSAIPDNLIPKQEYLDSIKE